MTLSENGDNTHASLRELALAESREFAHRFVTGDLDWCLSRLAPDFFLVGPMQGQTTCDRAEVEKILREGAAQNAGAALAEEEYTVVSEGASTCTVLGVALKLIPPNNEEILAARVRSTYVWRRTGQGVLLDHIHCSEPKDPDLNGQSFPSFAGTETYRYMRSLIKLGNSRTSVSIYDVNGTVHWVHPSQIVYLEANRKRTIVHCMTRDIMVPAVIKDTVEMVGPKIVRVHRSYAVNRDHVVELKAGRLLLDDGTSISIPAKRIADVRAELSSKA